MTAPAYRSLIVSYRQWIADSPGGNWARVIDSVQNDKNVRVDERSAAPIMFQVQRQARHQHGWRVVGPGFRARFPEFRRLLPPSVEMGLVYDGSESDSANR